MESSRNKPFISFKLSAFLSSVTKSHIITLHPGRSVDHPFVRHVHDGHTPCHSVTCYPVLVIRLAGAVQQSLSFSNPYFILNNGRKVQKQGCQQLGDAKEKLLCENTSMYREKILNITFSTLRSFRHSLEVLDCIPCG